jgi:hypothetical protein
MERKMGLENHIKTALIEDGFDLEHLEFGIGSDPFGMGVFFEINTTAKQTIEAIVSCLFSEVLTVGVTVERFSGVDHTMILIDDTVKFGVINEMNTHELDNDIDMPLEQCPVFFQAAM